MGYFTPKKPEDIKHDFTFDVNYTNYEPNQGLLNNIDNQSGLGDKFSSAYDNMMDPSSPWYQQMYGDLRSNIGDSYANMTSDMNTSLAQRGIGGGGLSSLLGASNINKAGEQIKQGQKSIFNSGMGMASQFGQMASGAYGQAGGLLNNIDTKRLQTDMSNNSESNAYNQYLNTSQYNLSALNKQRQDAWKNQRSNARLGLLNTALTIGGSLLGGPMGGAVGKGIGSMFSKKGSYSPNIAPQSGGFAMNNFPDIYQQGYGGGYTGLEFDTSNIPAFDPSGNSGVTYP